MSIAPWDAPSPISHSRYTCVCISNSHSHVRRVSLRAFSLSLSVSVSASLAVLCLSIVSCPSVSCIHHRAPSFRICLLLVSWKRGLVMRFSSNRCRRGWFPVSSVSDAVCSHARLQADMRGCIVLICLIGGVRCCFWFSTNDASSCALSLMETEKDAIFGYVLRTTVV